MQKRFPEASLDAIVARTGVVPLLVVVTLLMMIPGLFTLPPMDRDEPRFAQASKQMLETSDFVAIRFGEEARNKKPVGIHWLQAGAVGLGEALGVTDARRQIWLYRLPSLAGAVLAVLLTYWAALPMVSGGYALIAALLVSATPLLGVEARLATTDAVLLATVVAAMGALARVYLVRRPQPGAGSLGSVAGVAPRHTASLSRGAERGSAGLPAQPRLGTAVVFWAAIGVGLLIKGPITPLVVGLAAAALSLKDRSGRWLRALRPLPGVVLCLLVVLPWFVLILVQTKGAFLTDAVGHDLLGKVAGDQESHGAPPGFYALTFWLTGWPLAPFVPLVAAVAWRCRREPAVSFLLAWVLPTWLVFEVFHTKLVHYALPLFPGLAILAAWGLERLAQPATPIRRRAFGAWILFGLLALLPALVLGLAVGGQGRLWDLGAGGMALAGIATALALALAWTARSCFAASQLRAAGFAAVLAGIPVYAFVYGDLLTPGVAAPLAVSPRLAAAARDALGGDCPAPLYATAGDREPSLMFATTGKLLMTDAAGAARFVGDGTCRVAFVDGRDDAAFKAALDPAAPVREAARVTGIAINGGAKLDIGVYIRP